MAEGTLHDEFQGKMSIRPLNLLARNGIRTRADLIAAPLTREGLLTWRNCREHDADEILLLQLRLREQEAPGPVNFTDDEVTVEVKPDQVKIRLREFDIVVYKHQPSGGEAYMVIDIDDESDEPARLRVYRNDGLVHEEGAS